MRSKWSRYSSSSASRSPCCARSTSLRTRAGQSGRSVSTDSWAVTRARSPCLGGEPDARLAEEAADIRHLAQGDRVVPVVGLEPDGALAGVGPRLRAADRRLQRLGRLRVDDDAQRLTTVKADLDTNPLINLHGKPPPRGRRGRNLDG